VPDRDAASTMRLRIEKETPNEPALAEAG
jgi:hypothetical protein